jgi:branched-subunit amino acid ABC-type transport system permease component
MFALGWLLQRHVLNRVLGDDILPPLLVTFGLSMVIQNGLLEALPPTAGAFPPVRSKGLGGARASHGVGVMPLLTFVSAIAVIVALNRLFYRTALGRAFRATSSDDPVTASLMGIRPQRDLCHGHRHRHGGGHHRRALSGHAGEFRPDSIGPARLIYAFEAVIIGGLGSLWGTLAGGIIIGWRRRWAPRSTPNGRSWRAMSPLSSCCCAAARPVSAGQRLMADDDERHRTWPRDAHAAVAPVHRRSGHLIPVGHRARLCRARADCRTCSSS